MKGTMPDNDEIFFTYTLEKIKLLNRSF